MKRLKIRPEGKVRKFIKTIFLFAYHWLENNSINFNKGEAYTISAILDSLSKRKKRFIFIDVGANVGEYAEHVILECKQNKIDFEGHLFEPVKENFVRLRNRFMNEANLSLNNFGISDVAMSIGIHLGGSHSSIERNEIIGAYNKREYHELETIVVKRLDEYLIENNITDIDFLKIDTEGHEMKVLESIESFVAKQKIDFIQYEYGDGHIFSKNFCRDFYNFFERNGYRVFKIKPNYFEDRPYDFYMENFKSANYLAISRNKLEELKYC